MQPRRRPAVALRTMVPVRSPLPERQPDRCYGSWESAVTDSFRALILLALGQVSAFSQETTGARAIVAVVTAPISLPHGPAGRGSGSAPLDLSPCRPSVPLGEARAAGHV